MTDGARCVCDRWLLVRQMVRHLVRSIFVKHVSVLCYRCFYCCCHEFFKVREKLFFSFNFFPRVKGKPECTAVSPNTHTYTPTTLSTSVIYKIRIHAIKIWVNNILPVSYKLLIISGCWKSSWPQFLQRPLVLKVTIVNDAGESLMWAVYGCAFNTVCKWRLFDHDDPPLRRRCHRRYCRW